MVLSAALKGAPVSGVLIQEKALAFFVKLYPDADLYHNYVCRRRKKSSVNSNENTHFLKGCEASTRATGKLYISTSSIFRA